MGTVGQQFAFAKATETLCDCVPLTSTEKKKTACLLCQSFRSVHVSFRRLMGAFLVNHQMWLFRIFSWTNRRFLMLQQHVLYDAILHTHTHILFAVETICQHMLKSSVEMGPTTSPRHASMHSTGTAWVQHGSDIIKWQLCLPFSA